VLQGVAGCCRVLQGVAVYRYSFEFDYVKGLYRYSVAGCCRVLQYVAVRCSV